MDWVKERRNSNARRVKNTRHKAQGRIAGEEDRVT